MQIILSSCFLSTCSTCSRTWGHWSGIQDLHRIPGWDWKACGMGFKELFICTKSFLGFSCVHEFGQGRPNTFRKHPCEMKMLRPSADRMDVFFSNAFYPKLITSWCCREQKPSLRESLDRDWQELWPCASSSCPCWLLHPCALFVVAVGRSLSGRVGRWDTPHETPNPYRW